MTAAWIFKALRPGDKDRQPTQGEFFATDAIGSIAEALVRESIQNSLDARPDEATDAVIVRYHFGAVSSAVARKYFSDGWSHFSAAENGLNDVPSADEDCDFLLVEDFGTTGLTGDVTQWRHVPGANNPFYYFFRTEGRSGKGEEDRGRWGIGKYVFPRSSRINSLMGLTVRCDDGQKILMGQAILKSHAVAGNYFTPDGNYGVLGDDGLVLPDSDLDNLRGFTDDFSLLRDAESGLSVVIPWIFKDEATGLNPAGICRAVVEDYFFPILAGTLVVMVSSDSGEIEINKTTISDICETFGGDLGATMRARIELSRRVLESSADALFTLNPTEPERPVWKPIMIPEPQIADIRDAYRAGKTIEVKVPLVVRQKRKAQRESFFHIYMVFDGRDEGLPIFIRDGIIISDVRARRVQGVCSLVVVVDPPLAGLLGDSENPAHTQWQKDSEHFRDKYIFGKSYIDFVSQSVSTLVRYISETDEKPDKDLLRNIFFLPKPVVPDEPKEKSKPRRRNSGVSINPEPMVERRKRRFTLTKVSGGFSVCSGDPATELPAGFEIAVAYDRRRGSPIKRYSDVDFQLNENPINVAANGLDVIACSKNRMTVRVSGADFNLTVTGFDENRDLFVNVRPTEAGNDPQA